MFAVSRPFNSVLPLGLTLSGFTSSPVSFSFAVDEAAGNLGRRDCGEMRNYACMPFFGGWGTS